MTIQEITDKYLPMLQDLQRNAAGRMGMTMDIRVDKDSIMADITTYDGKDITDYTHLYFAEWRTEQEMDSYFMQISAFFAAQITVNPMPVVLNNVAFSHP